VLFVGCEERICLSKLPQLVMAEIEKYADWYWGIDVFAHQKGLPFNYLSVFSFQRDRMFNPASNNKLLTCSAILTELGPKYRFLTASLYSDSCLQLAGDPSLTYERLQAILAPIKPNSTIQIDASSYFGPYCPSFVCVLCFTLLILI